jgi:hypothetical protein
MELYLHTPTRLHGVVFELIQRGDKFAFSIFTVKDFHAF